jgi:hypothetical protein
MNFKNDFAGYDFTWFIGEVEARNDPLKLGRVKVRCFGWHPKDRGVMPTSDLPWAQTIQPVTAPPAAPTGLTNGTWVFGFFMDGDKAQRPMIMGMIPGYRFDETGKGESELPRAARVEEEYPSPQSELRKNTRITDISLNAGAGSTWSEPEEPADKDYPFVQTVSSESGFVTETIQGPYTTPDDFVGPPEPTQFTARQVTYDCTGGYDERRAPSGDKIVKVIGDNYEIVCGSSFINIKGDVNMTVDGSMRQNISGDYELNVAGNMYTIVGGTDDKYIVKDQVLGILGTRDTYIGGVSLSGNVGDKKVVALGGVADTVAAGGRIITTTGAVVDTTVGNYTKTVTGLSIDTVNGSRQFITNGSLIQTATTHTISLGSGALGSTGTASITNIIGTTITGGQIYTSTLKTSAVGTVNIMTHKHTETGSITTVPIP